MRLPGLVALSLCICALSRPVHPQQEKVVVLEHADSLIGKVLEGENARELAGHVRFRQGSTIITCDRAVQFLQSHKMSLRGNVFVKDDTMTLRGQRGMYYNADRVAEAYDGVRLQDGTTTLIADYGRYSVEEKKAFFRDNVEVQDTASTLRAHELTYFREDKRSVADGDVAIHNESDRLTIYGGHFENYPASRFSRMTLQPRVVQIDTTEGQVDTFVVHSRIMESHRDSLRRLVAIDSVRMSSSQLAGESGFAIYLTELDSIIMRKNPFVWYGENQVSGDSIFIRLHSRKPEKVYVRGDAFAVSRNQPLYPKRYDQLSGDLITMYFTAGKVHRIEVDRTATSVYFLFEDKEDSLGIARRPNGLNKTSGDRVTVYFKDGRADRISVVSGVEGQYFPENMVDRRETEYYLPGFNWREDRPPGLARTKALPIGAGNQRRSDSTK